MEALLREAGEGLGRGVDSDGPPGVRSVEDLKTRIAQLFVGKVTETHAAHVSASFDIPADVVLNLGDAINAAQPPPTDGAGAPPTAADNDPDVATIRSGAVLNGLLRNFVTVREVVVSQPETGAALQRAVAAFVMMHVRQADGSQWTVQDATRTTQGWMVTYGCQRSMACWAKKEQPKKRTVGASSLEDMQDAASLARPAYDCRGVVMMTFSRFSRSLVVKYEHTNFHRTVAELAALFPPPRPPSPLAGALATTPKAKTASKKKPAETGPDGEPLPKRVKQPPTEASIARAARRKAQRERLKAEKLAAKAADAAAAGEGGEGAAPPPGQPGLELTKSGKPKRPRKPKPNASAVTDAAGGGENASAIASAAADMMDLGIDVGHDTGPTDEQVADALMQHLNEFPQDNTQSAAAMMDALVEHSSASDANWLTHVVAAAETPAATTAADPPYKRVTEAEVSTVRRQAAIKLLTSRSIDPATLTHDQFCTFANQAPTLQRESLELLAHYGAERLAIVPAETNAHNDAQRQQRHYPGGGSGSADDVYSRHNDAHRQQQHYPGGGSGSANDVYSRHNDAHRQQRHYPGGGSGSADDVYSRFGQGGGQVAG